MDTQEAESITTEALPTEAVEQVGETEEKMTATDTNSPRKHRTAARNSEATIFCPECRKRGIDKTFESRAGLSSHRRSAHGVAGMGTTAVWARAKKAAATPKKVGRPRKDTNSSAPRKSHHTPKPPAPPVQASQPFAPSMLGYAMGRMQSLAEQIARENNLPEKQFVNQVALNFAALVQS